MIYRSKTDNIIFEYTYLENPRGVILLCDGLPSVPKQKALMEMLEKRGYMSIFPRYGGSWESDGEFLRRSPAEDIRLVISYLKKGKILDLYSGKEIEIRHIPFYVIGSSFGGAVAMEISSDEDISKVVALSPLIDFRRYEKWDSLKAFLRKAYANAFRFSDEDWNSMASGNLIKPDRCDKDKLLVIYGEGDATVDSEFTKSWCEKNNIEHKNVSGVGHISFGKIDESILSIIMDWIK